MIKRFFGTFVTVAAIAVAGKMVSDYAETKPELKNVKEKLKKTGKDFSDDCKEVGLAIKDIFNKKTSSKEAETVSIG